MAHVDQVVLISIDGLRPDALQKANTPHIDGIYGNGAATYEARTVMPASTLPCHTSMFRGVIPERHGITMNTWVPQVRPIPSIIDVVHQEGLKTRAFYNWEQLRDLSDPGSLNSSYFADNCDQPAGDLVIAEQAARSIKDERGPGFTFVYLGHTDVEGHNSGWMSEPYIEAIGNADQAIGMVLSELDKDRTAILVTSDHGGHGMTHGTDSPEDMTIPWGMCGPGIAKCELSDRVAIIDTPATIADLLGIPIAADWVGKSVLSILPT